MASLHALVVTVAVLAGANSAAGGETALLDFTSANCGPCRQMAPIVHQLAANGYPVRVVDTGQNPHLAAQYRVSGIPCFVMVVNGQEVDRVVGATSVERLRQMLAKADQGGNESGDPRRGTPAHLASTPLPSKSAVAPLGRESQVNPAGAAAPANAEQLQPLIDRLMQASVRIRVTGDGQSFDTGSGTVIAYRAGEALILTCGHVFRDTAGRGQMTVDFFGAQPERGVPAQMIGYDLRRDVGLICARPSRAIVPIPVATVGVNAQVTETVISIGCDHGNDPTAKVSRVTSIDKYVGPPNLQVAGQPEVGRSGGGLFNLQGEVIGVCNAKDPEYNEGLYAALASVHAELDRHQMQTVYQRISPPLHERLAETVTPPSMADSMPRATAPRSTIYDSLATNLNSDEAAALLAIQNHSAEILLHVQTASDQADGRRGLTLSNASPEFLRRLAAWKEGQQPPSFTTQKEIQPPAQPAGTWPGQTTADHQPIPPWRGGSRLAPVPSANEAPVINRDLRWRQLGN